MGSGLVGPATIAGHRGRVVAGRLGWLRWSRTCRHRLGVDDAPSLRAPGVESLLWSHLLRGHSGLRLSRRDRLTWLVASARSDRVSCLSDPFDLLRSLGCARTGCTGAGSSPKRTTRASSLASGGCRRWCCLLDGSLDSRTHGASGNLTLLVTNGASRKGLGVDAGFRVLGAQGSVRPIWLTRATITGWHTAIGSFRSPRMGSSFSALMISIAVVARVSGHPELSSVAILATLCSLATVFMFTSYPVAERLFLYYVDVIWWVEGIVLWVVVGVAALVGLRSLSSRRLAASNRPPPESSKPSRRWAMLAGSVVVLLSVSTVLGVRADGFTLIQFACNGGGRLRG